MVESKTQRNQEGSHGKAAAEKDKQDNRESVAKDNVESNNATLPAEDGKERVTGPSAVDYEARDVKEKDEGDYTQPGTATEPYSEREDFKPNSTDHYGYYDTGFAASTDAVGLVNPLLSNKPPTD